MTDTSQRLDIILVKLHSPERKLRYILCFNSMCETCITKVASKNVSVPKSCHYTFTTYYYKPYSNMDVNKGTITQVYVCL